MKKLKIISVAAIPLIVFGVVMLSPKKAEADCVELVRELRMVFQGGEMIDIDCDLTGCNCYTGEIIAEQ